MSNNIHEIEIEINDATEQLRETLHEFNDRVEEGIANLRPGREVRRHPMAAACAAGSVGFALGSDSKAASVVGLLVLSAAVVFLHGRERDEQGPHDVERD